jgi:hypothetical protein
MSFSFARHTILKSTRVLVFTTVCSSVALADPPPETSGPPPGAAAAEPEQPTDSEDPIVSRARGAFKLGASLAREGQWADALVAFERAAELRPHAVITYNIAYVERALGRLTRAKVRFEAALRDESASEDRRLPADLAVLARSYLAEIDQKLAQVSITLERPDLAVAIDGRPLEVLSNARATRPVLIAGTAPLGPPVRLRHASFELLVDPGPHILSISTDGGRETVQHQKFEQGARSSLYLTGGAPGGPSTSGPKAQPVAADKPPEQGTSHSTWMWVAYGVGAAGVVAGSVFGLLAIDQDNALNDACSGGHVCPKANSDDIARLDVYTWGANIGWIVGGVGAGVGTYFLITGGAEKKTTASPSARIGIAPGAMVLRGAF